MLVKEMALNLKGDKMKFILKPNISDQSPGIQVIPKFHVPTWRQSCEAFSVTEQRKSQVKAPFKCTGGNTS